MNTNVNNVSNIYPDKFVKPVGRFLSEKESSDFARRASSFVAGGGDLALFFTSSWRGFSKAARNRVIGSGDLRLNKVKLMRDILGVSSEVAINQIDDIGIEAAVRRAERLLDHRPYVGGRIFREHYASIESIGLDRDDSTASVSDESEYRKAIANLAQEVEEYSRPKIFFESTYSLESPGRLGALKPILETVEKEKLFSAAHVEASASGRVIIDSIGRSLYYPYTESQYSLTVRDPAANASGWAGVDFGDWSRIDPALLTEIAVDKCLRSRNPVAVEPGRYTAILEPQAVSDIVSPMIQSTAFDRRWAHLGNGLFSLPGGYTKIGLKVFDDRITISSDPMDPDIGFPPFSEKGEVYHPVTWVENGILKELAYSRSWAIDNLGINKGLPNSYAYRMKGGDASIEDMVISTRRGILVTRFSRVSMSPPPALIARGFTRDGLWLIENGKITKAIKNFQFLESPVFMLNQVDTIGPAQKVFRPGYPTVVPSMKVRDFNFISTIDAV